MEGMARAAKRNLELAITGAWHAEAFARTKRMKKLSAYLPGEQPLNGGDDVIGIFRAMKKGGKPVSIRKLN
jgi:hypothetical protein